MRALLSPSWPLLSVFALALAGCPEGDPPVDGGPDEDECEVDLLFSAETAEDLTLGEEVTGVLCPARDVDWYAFTVDTPGSVVEIHLSMDTAITPVEPGYTIVTANDIPTGITGREVDGSAGEAVDFVGSHRIDEAGDYIIKIADVEGFDDRFDIAAMYALTVNVLADPDGNELNEDADTATDVTIGTPITGLIATVGDHDWYAVPVTADGQILDVNTRAPTDIGISLVVEAYAPDGTTLIAQTTLAEDGEELSARLRIGASSTVGDTYYVHVYEESDELAQSDPDLGTYELVVDVLADPDPNELGNGNENVNTAVAAASGDAFVGALATSGDQDYFRIDPPAGTTANNPRVLVVDLTFENAVGADVQPQIRVITPNPERADDNLAGCGSCDGECVPDGNGSNACGEAYLQRVLTSGTSYRTAFPLRRTRPLFVSINDLGDDGFQEVGTYDIAFTIVDDPDPGEVGDDYLIPNLQTAAYENDGELAAQFSQSRARARNIANPAVGETCPPPDPDLIEITDAGVVINEPECDAGVADGGDVTCGPQDPPGCIPIAPVAAPGPGGQLPYAVDCNGESWTVEASGRITYEGDRDFFVFYVPESGYWGIDTTYSVSTTTPVELTVFVHDRNDLIGAWLEAIETGGQCDSSIDCSPGSVCIDEKCWADSDSNPAFSGHTFPGTGQCLFVHVNTPPTAMGPRPIYVEVTDNGINDFDLDMEYTVSLTMQCGCPTACNGGFDACQGMPSP